MLFSSLVLAFATPLPPAPQDPGPASIDSRIAEVTVYGGSASVRRRASIPEGDGEYLVAGLPFGLDPDSVRVRCAGGEVVGVEVRDRYESNVPDERVAELRERLRQKEREYAGLRDEQTVAESMEAHIGKLLRQEEQLHQGEVRAGRVDPSAWEANFTYLRGKLSGLRTELRQIGWRIEDADLELRDLRTALGRFESAGGVQLRDVLVEVVGARGVAALEVEYVVGNAGWAPYYDLRAQQDLSRVELVYRAKVWQRTGEDWRDVDVLLSTSQPQRGAQGPELRPTWLSLYDSRQPALSARARYSAEDEALDKLADVAGMMEPMPSAAPKPYASVQNEGISVRFRLNGRQTVESRDEPSTVLVGRKNISIRAEHYCVPALDATVWLRALARNTSDWVMLPGRAAVYFGADFVGHADVPAVQVGQRLTMHLGPDPGLVVERTKLVDTREGSGLFSSKDTLVESWRIDVENVGAFSPRADGSVDVIVHEVLPRSRDDRIKVSIERVSPDLNDAPRWEQERQEKGVLTWVIRVPRSMSKRLEIETEIRFPEDEQLVRR